VRIVAGQWRGRRLKAPKGDAVRPTADRVREAWMSIVQPWLPEAKVLDLFAGSGALGIEALSRGAASVDFVESAPASIRLITENLGLVAAGESATLHRADAVRYAAALEESAYDIAFADPPYDKGLAVEIANLWIAKPFAGILGIEHRSSEKLPGEGDRRRYGDTSVTFYWAS
jgi:16S rRNA (guanine966-N2)-methyltransferase